MEVVAKIGPRGRIGSVSVDGQRFKAYRSRSVPRTIDAWIVEGPGVLGSSRVTYSMSGYLIIDGPTGHVEVRFHPGRTEFSYRNRIYAIEDLQWGEIPITDRDRVLVRGDSTSSGVRLATEDSDLEPIAREIAWGLALRTYDLAKEYGFGRGAA